MPRRHARAAMVLSAALVAVACSKPLDIAGLETQLANQVNAQLATTAVTVSCPDGVKAEAGGTFNCTGTLATGDTLVIRVIQTDASGRVTWEVVDAASPSPSPSVSPSA